MRKTVIAAAMILTVAMAGSAYARMGGGMYGGMGYAQCALNGGQYYQGANFQRGQFNGRNMMAQANVQRGPRTITQYTEAEAEKMIKDYAAANLKGYEVGKLEAFTSPRGFIIWSAPVTDNAGNKLSITVTPNGIRTGQYPFQPMQGRGGVPVK
jgi:hypothetical protein